MQAKISHKQDMLGYREVSVDGVVIGRARREPRRNGFDAEWLFHIAGGIITEPTAEGVREAAIACAKVEEQEA